MGIGNVGNGDLKNGVRQLITPHGDRERGAQPRHLPTNGAHYPSWGSGTCPGGPTRELLHVLQHLITPHGDRELRIKATAGGDPQLITPHGDRERTRRQSSGPRLPSHYPSWGSGTGFVHCAYRHILNSLPLMGIGNELIHVRVRDKLLLITPHGDREQSVALEAHRAFPNSLPLMGIGNFFLIRELRPPFLILASLPLMGIGNSKLRRLPATAHHLITPHGDREPTASEAELQAELTLITPHGDRELNTLGKSRGYSPNSLPLMGIGNGRAVDSSAAASRNSLPLMGIGNHYGKPWLRAICEAHYPSWGSGTGTGAALQDADHAQLITPHGDREQVGRSSQFDNHPSHYPSWGSGTAVFRVPKDGKERLITPHGDRERGIGYGPCGISASHYPSWGSGTHRRAGRVRDHVLLITPHGDRERLLVVGVLSH